MMLHSEVSLVVKLNLTQFFGVDSCGWTVVRQSAESVV